MVRFGRQDAFEAEAVDVFLFENVRHAMPVEEVGDAFFRFLADFVAALAVADENVDVLDEIFRVMRIDKIARRAAGEVYGRVVGLRDKLKWF